MAIQTGIIEAAFFDDSKGRRSLAASSRGLATVRRFDPFGSSSLGAGGSAGAATTFLSVAATAMGKKEEKESVRARDDDRWKRREGRERIIGRGKGAFERTLGGSSSLESSLLSLLSGLLLVLGGEAGYRNKTKEKERRVSDRLLFSNATKKERKGTNNPKEQRF